MMPGDYLAHRFPTDALVLGIDRRRRLYRIGWYDPIAGRSVRRWFAEDPAIRLLSFHDDAQDFDYMSTFTVTGWTRR